MIVFIIIILLYVNQSDDNIDNIKITTAHISKTNIESINTIYANENLAEKIHVYSYEIKYRLKIYFNYVVSSNEYKGSMYYPDSNYISFDSINKIKLHFRKNSYFILFYDKQNPKKYWIE
jgi:hypothetical protein